ncbi:MAG: bifunctional phosphoribosylaminoimidazolecarboxamide formyltransferase/IMP cyclohydrolase, partial [Pseudohongiella sp.]|nr:bifunctional phosphoribosylaminoimidazolecarboxamide formyltransferase/IMP cyclohydrolase [Pseudohongiella sp.]
MSEHGLPYIDLVCVNLYPFVATVSKPHTLDDAIENIDIGGPAMVRSSAKNYRFVAIVTDPADYPALVSEMQANGGALTDATRFDLAKKAFTHTAEYDGAISNYLTALNASNERETFGAKLNLQFTRAQICRYGENPHQAGAFYVETNAPAGTIATARQIQGKELSYNNIADADAAWECVKSFDRQQDGAACVILKHANPCGVAIGADALEAYSKAFKTDPTSAFGGIIALNCPLDERAALQISKQFVEVLMAPSFTPGALEVMKGKVNVRLLQIDLPPGGATAWQQGRNLIDVKRVGSGLLMQTADNHELLLTDLKVVSKLQPTPAQLQDLLFAWKVATYVKSNAIVFCGGGMTLGVGAGQMSRVDSARIASIKAANAGLSLQGSAVASDAFFPFRDGLDVVVDAGAACVIQPGGSIRDEEVIAAANERGVAMVLTGVRHFRH